LKNSLRLDPQNLAYWKDLSSTYYLAKNYPATLSVLDVIAKVEKPNAGTWFIRALCYDNLQQAQPALDAYQSFWNWIGTKIPTRSGKRSNAASF